MPTVLYLRGWRFFFYSNEGNEPIHIHVQKGEKEGKYWLDVETYEISEAYTYNFSSQDVRDVRKIMFQNFDEFVEAWDKFRGEQQ